MTAIFAALSSWFNSDNFLVAFEDETYFTNRFCKVQSGLSCIPHPTWQMAQDGFELIQLLLGIIDRCLGCRETALFLLRRSRIVWIDLFHANCRLVLLPLVSLIMATRTTHINFTLKPQLYSFHLLINFDLETSCDSVRLNKSDS